MKLSGIAVKSKLQAGTSLIETLLIVCAISTLATLAYTIITSVMPDSTESKLERQIAVLNASATIYRINGSHFDPSASTTEIFKQLQMASLEEEAAQIVGFAGPMVDPDLQAIPTSKDETNDTSIPRVIWNAQLGKFKVSHHQQPGIKSFYLDVAGSNDRAINRESRLPGGVVEYAAKDDWVWDYNDTPIHISGPDYIPGPGGPGNNPPNPPPSAPQSNVLAPPLISLPEGTYPITNYQLQVTLADPNPPGSARVFYSVNHGPLRPYKGQVLTFNPQEYIAAISKPTSSEWKRSIYSVAYYTASPVRLDPPIIHASAPQFNWDVNDTIHITLDNPNSSEVSKIKYRINGGKWKNYKNKSIRINKTLFPDGVTINTRATPTAEYYLASHIRSRKVGPAVAVVLNPPLISFSASDFTKHTKNIKVTLTNPNPSGSSDIYYAITDPEKFRDESKELSYQKYSKKFDVKKKGFKHGFAVIAYAKARNPGYQDSTRAEQETGTVDPGTPPPPSSPDDEGLPGGHFDLDTSSFITKFHRGTTDAHVHAYDDKYNVTGADFLDLKGGSLHNLSDDVPNGNRFKIIIVNPDLSPGARLVINRDYDEKNPDTWIPVQAYANIPTEDLPTFSLTGIPNTTQLTSFGIYFSRDSLYKSDLIPSNTGDVRSNVPGKNGEWRNGALTLQAVKVNAGNAHAFTTSKLVSNGGKHGGATNGLLWEAVLFHHWHGDSYHEKGNTWAATPYVAPENPGITDPLISRYFTGKSTGEFHNPTGDRIPATNLDNNQLSNFFKWGKSNDKSSLFFTGNSFESVALDEQFELGTMEFYNSAKANGNSTIHVEFDVNLNLEDPVLTENLGFAFDIFGTRDQGNQTADQNADYLKFSNPSTTFNTEIDGQLYGLSLQFGDVVSNGYSSGDSLYGHEGTTASGTLYGSFYMYDPADLSEQLIP